MGCKAVIFISLALALLSSGGIAVATTPPGGGVSPGGSTLAGLFQIPVQQVQGAGSMTCNSPLYTTQRLKNACQSCATPVEQWKKKFPEIAQRYSNNDNGFLGIGSLFASRQPASVDGELAAFRSQQANARGGATTQTNRARNASEAKSEFDRCKEEINKGCGNGKQIMLAPSDKEVAQAVTKACEDASNGSGQFANDKKKDAGGLGDLSKLMDAASKAMQAMKGQEGAQTPAATSPTPDSLNPQVASAGAAPEIEKTKLDGGNGIAASSIGFGSPVPGAKTNVDVPGTGSALSGLGIEGGRNRFGDTPFGGAPNGSSASTSGPGGGSGGGGGGVGNSSGASLPGAGGSTGAGAAADNSSAYEVNGGGGRGGAIVGLKPSKGDLADVAEGATPPLDTAQLDDLGNRDPASEGGVQEDVLAKDAESIFLRVRSRYSLLKGSGRI